MKSGVIYFSGLRISSLMQIQDSVLKPYAPIPLKTHNAHPYGRGALLNDTAADRISYLDMRGSIIESFGIKRYPNEQLLMSGLPQDHARQAFGRGLRAWEDKIIGGSSPATVSLYQLGKAEAFKTVNLSVDVRNAIHGLEIWPFS